MDSSLIVPFTAPYTSASRIRALSIPREKIAVTYFPVAPETRRKSIRRAELFYAAGIVAFNVTFLYGYLSFCRITFRHANSLRKTGEKT